LEAKVIKPIKAILEKYLDGQKVSGTWNNVIYNYQIDAHRAGYQTIPRILKSVE